MADNDNPIPIKTALRGKPLEPLEPIELDGFGNQLEEWLPEGSSKRTLETDPLPSHNKRPQIGVHSVCGGAINRLPCSTKFDVLICHWCLLRVQIPVDINSYHLLRVYTKRVKSEREREIEDRRRARLLCDMNTPMG